MDSKEERKEKGKKLEGRHQNNKSTRDCILIKIVICRVIWCPIFKSIFKRRNLKKEKAERNRLYARQFKKQVNIYSATTFVTPFCNMLYLC